MNVKKVYNVYRFGVKNKCTIFISLIIKKCTKFLNSMVVSLSIQIDILEYYLPLYERSWMGVEQVCSFKKPLSCCCTSDACLVVSRLAQSPDPIRKKSEKLGHVRRQLGHKIYCHCRISKKEFARLRRYGRNRLLFIRQTGILFLPVACT